MIEEFFGQIYRIFKTGTFFGEIILEQGGQRTASSVVLEDTQFLTINQDDYDGIFKEKKLLSDQRKIQGLTTILPVIQTLKKVQCLELIYSLNEIQLRRGDTLYKEGRTYSSIAFLSEGSIVLKKRINPPTLIKLFKKAAASEEISSADKVFLAEAIKYLSSTEINIDAASFNKNLEITTLKGWCLIGEECILDSDPTMSFSCECLTDCTIYSFEKTDISKYFPIGFKQYLVSIFEQKVRKRMKMYTNMALGIIKQFEQNHPSVEFRSYSDFMGLVNKGEKAQLAQNFRSSRSKKKEESKIEDSLWEDKKTTKIIKQKFSRLSRTRQILRQSKEDAKIQAGLEARKNSNRLRPKYLADSQTSNSFTLEKPRAQKFDEIQDHWSRIYEQRKFQLRNERCSYSPNKKRKRKMRLTLQRNCQSFSKTGTGTKKISNSNGTASTRASNMNRSTIRPFHSKVPKPQKKNSFGFNKSFCIGKSDLLGTKKLEFSRMSGMQNGRTMSNFQKDILSLATDSNQIPEAKSLFVRKMVASQDRRDSSLKNNQGVKVRATSAKKVANHKRTRIVSARKQLTTSRITRFDSTR